MTAQKKLAAFVLALSFLLTMLTGCGTYTEDGDASTGGDPQVPAQTDEPSGSDTSDASGPSELTIICQQPNTLNMIQSTSNLDSYAFYLTQEMLFRPYDGNYQPEAVDTWEVDETNTVYTYHLKETTWADGTPITAADFAYYLISRLDPSSGSMSAGDLVASYNFVNSAAFMAGECDASEVGVKAEDDLTLVLTLEAPMADFDGTNIVCYPLDADFVAEQGEALGGTVENYMSSGPYILTEWVYDAYLTYEKNPNWVFAAGQFPLDKVTVLNTLDPGTAASMFESGEADVILTTGSDYLTILADSLVYNPGSAIRAVQFNTYGQGDAEKAALLSNKNFRMALSYALDREAINTAVNPTGAGINRYLNAPITGKTAESYFADDFPVETVPMNGDPEKARACLQAALDELGYASAADLPELSYLTFENDSYRLTGETLVDQWKQVLGIDCITIELQPIPDAIGKMMSYQYDLYYTSMSNSTVPSGFLNYWTTTGAINDVTGSGMPLFSNEEYDRLVRSAATELDRETRMALYAQAEQILIDEAPLVMINSDGSYSAVSDRVSGFFYNSYDEALELNQTTVK